MYDKHGIKIKAGDVVRVKFHYTPERTFVDAYYLVKLCPYKGISLLRHPKSSHVWKKPSKIEWGAGELGEDYRRDGNHRLIINATLERYDGVLKTHLWSSNEIEVVDIRSSIC